MKVDKLITDNNTELEKKFRVLSKKAKKLYFDNDEAKMPGRKNLRILLCDR
jgi:hypothetical protein